MRAPAWVLLAIVVPFIAASPILVERDFISDTITSLGQILSSVIGLAQNVLTLSLLTSTAYITPAASGGKRIAITGNKYLVTGLDAYLGIPFAEPLTGTKKFDKPSPKQYTGNINARSFGKACMQNIPLMDGGVGQSEDCLTLNVVTPSGAAGSGKKLPVMVWIYGGGFFGGGASYYSAFEVAVQQYARQRNQPVIHVAMNYRLGIWGWGLGKEFKAAGLANNGIRDQKVALQWVKENIANFGGDPNKITLYGESAGAISTAIHLLDQRNEGLFHGAIMQSGSASTLPSPRTEEYQGPYDDIVAAAGCSGAADTFDCLKGKSQDQLASAQLQVNLMSKYTMGIVAITWRPSVDGDIIPDFPSKLLSAGKFAPIPWISGTNKDEATLFVNWLLQKEDEIMPMINKLFPKPLPQNLVNTILAKYPNDASLGCPFNTGDNTFGLSVAYKQAAAISSDATFISKRRFLLRQANSHGHTQTWSYEFEGPMPILPGFLGIAHATDIPYTFGIVSPLLAFAGWTGSDQSLSQTMMAYWLNFAYTQNPNGGGLPDWPTHNYPSNANSLLFAPNNVNVIQDTFREDRIAVFNDPQYADALCA